MRVVQFAEEALESCNRTKSVGHDPPTRIPLLLDYRRLIFIGVSDNMLFIHEFTWSLMQIKALIVLIVCMLSYFKYISIILHNFMLWYKNTSFYG